MKTTRAVLATTLALAALLFLGSCLAFEELAGSTEEPTGQKAAAQEARQRAAERESDAGNWDLARLETARAASYLSEREKDVVLELNKARTDPQRYAELYLMPTLRYYRGREYRRPGSITMLTQEGRTAVEECIRVMSAARPMGALQPSAALAAAARDHARDTGPKGLVGHTGSDGSSLMERVRRYDKRPRPIAETISYGPAAAREIVQSLLIDDGVPGRGHRRIILAAGYDAVGLSIGSHKSYGNLCVIDFAQ